MIAPAAIPAEMASPEEAVKLAAYVERLTRYLTLPLTERLFGDEDVTDIQINSDGLVWLDRHSAGRVHEGDVLPPERVEMFVNAVAQNLGATFDARNSILEGELPGPVFLGSRLIALGRRASARPPSTTPEGTMLLRSRRTRLLLLAAALAACSSPDRRIAEGEEPIAALQVRHPSRRYDTAFWSAQARGSTALWAIALQFCRGEGRDLAAHPNCASVIAADAQSRKQVRSRRAARQQLAAAA